MEVSMSRRALKFAAVFAMTVLGGNFALAAEEGQAELLKALGGAKHTLLQHIGQGLRYRGGGQCVQRVWRRRHGSIMGAEQGGLRRPQAHRPVGAIPYVA